MTQIELYIAFQIETTKWASLLVQKIPKIIDPMKTKKQAFYTLNIPK